MTEQPTRWWLGRTSALITIAITLPVLVLAGFLVRSITSDLAHQRDMDLSLTAFEQGLDALTALHTMQHLSAARVHVGQGEVVEHYQTASAEAEQQLGNMVEAVQPILSPRIEDQSAVMMATWQELKVSPGWDVEDPSGPLENVGLTVRELYQTLAVVLHSNPTHSSADLRIHDLLRPILGPLRELRHEISVISNIILYSTLRDGYLNSVDAETLDDAWQSIYDLIELLRNQAAQLSNQTLGTEARQNLLMQLDQVGEFLMAVDNEVMLADLIEIEWQQARQLGSDAQQATEQISNTLLSQARQLSDRESRHSIVTAVFLSVLLITAYLALLGFSLLVYRSNFVAIQARQESVAKSNFLARMGHEIRTPMNGVLGLAELLRDTDPSAQQQEYIELIESAGRSLVTLINDILDYAKIEAGKMELESVEFDLRALVYESVHMFSLRADENQSLIVAHVDPGLPDTLQGDATRLRQVLINLISNAVKFTHEGRIEVLVRPADRAANDDDTLTAIRVEVRDTGIGIPEDSRESVFSVFSQASADVTRRFGGTGLGLAICREIMALMHGKIGVEENTPSGTVFWFELSLPGGAHSSASTSPAQVITVPQPAWLLDPAQQLGPFLAGHSQFQNVRVFAERAELLRQFREDGSSAPGMVVINGLDPTLNCAALAAELRQLRPGLHVRVVSGVRQSMGKDSDESQQVDSVIHRSVFTLPHLVRLFDARADSLQTNQHSHELPEQATLPPGLKVLVAEDNPVNQMVARGFLNRLGAGRVLVAENGRESVDQYVKQEGVDVVLMDLDMPEMDGFEASRVIRQRESQRGWRRSIILALSAHALPQYQQMVIDAGMDGQLIKPVTLQTLHAELTRALAAQSPQAPDESESH